MKVLCLGAGGHAKVVIDALRLRGFDIVGLIDPDEARHGSRMAGVMIAGGDELWRRFLAEGITLAAVTIGGAGVTAPRRALYDRARAAGFTIVDVIHPGAIVSASAKLGRGVHVLAGAIVNAEAVIGENSIINTAAVVEHDCLVGAHVHVATGAKLGGGVTVGDGAHIGIGASIRQSVHIGANAVVGAGAAVVKNVVDGATVAGVPARRLVRGDV